MKPFENNENAIQKTIQTSIEEIKSIAETDTIIGKAILSPNGSTIIPISKMSVGFVVGGGEYSMGKNKNQTLPFPMAATTGGGVALTPIGFLIEESGQAVKFVPACQVTGNEAIISTITSIITALATSPKETLTPKV